MKISQSVLDQLKSIQWNDLDQSKWFDASMDAISLGIHNAVVSSFNALLTNNETGVTTPSPVIIKDHTILKAMIIGESSMGNAVAIFKAVETWLNFGFGVIVGSGQPSEPRFIFNSLTPFFASISTSIVGVQNADQSWELVGGALETAISSSGMPVVGVISGASFTPSYTMGW